MSNRLAAEKYIKTYIEKISPGPENVKIYTDLFKSMSDKQFEEFMGNLETGKSRLAIIAPNFGTNKISTKNNLAIAKEIGYNFFQRIWFPATEDSPAYLSPISYLVVDLPIKRQAQLLVKKISIPEDNKSVDNFTGQPTSKSKGSSISYPEVQIMAAMGLNNCLTEFMKYRGGDNRGFNAMNDFISKSGGVSLDSIKHLASGVESTKVMKTFLTSMHIQSTLGQNG